MSLLLRQGRTTSITNATHADTVRISSGTISCRSAQLNSPVVLACKRNMSELRTQKSVVRSQSTHHSLLITQCSLLITHYSLLVTCYSLRRVAGVEPPPACRGLDKLVAPAAPSRSRVARRSLKTVWDRHQSKATG